jgi:hypothetical protein
MANDCHEWLITIKCWQSNMDVYDVSEMGYTSKICTLK